MFWLKAGAAAGLQDKGAAEGRGGWERGRGGEREPFVAADNPSVFCCRTFPHSPWHIKHREGLAWCHKNIKYF